MVAFASDPSPPPARRHWGVACPALLLGWIAHDLAVFAQAGEPEVAYELGLVSLPLLVFGVVYGWVCARGRWAVFAPLATAVGVTLAWKLFGVRFWMPFFWLARAAFYLGLALVVIGWARERWPHSASRLGLSLGALACVALTVDRGTMLYPSWLISAAAGLSLLLGFVPLGWLRVAATTMALLVPVVGVGLRVRASVPPERPDLTTPAVRADAGDRANLLLVVLDTVRADRLAPYGYWRVTTPGLDTFVEQHATVFTEARSTSSWTLPSHASLFTGLLPAEHGATHPRRPLPELDQGVFPAVPIRPDVPTLAEILRGAGYRTAGIVANGVYLVPAYGIDRGFEHFDSRRGGFVRDYLALAQLAGRRLSLGHLGYRDAASITDDALLWLDGRGDEVPFFLFLNYMEAHKPYVPPDATRRAFSDEQPRDPLHPTATELDLVYDRELLHVDAQVTRVLDGLSERGLFEDTLIVVTSDHGEALGDHGLWKHGWMLYEELVHVPLYVKPAGGRGSKTDDHPVTSKDVFGLILDELGIPPDGPEDPPADLERGLVSEWYGEWYTGDDLAKWEEVAAVRELRRDLVAWMDGDVKVLVSSRGEVEAFDLERDPDELEPLELAPEVQAEARARAAAWWAAHPPQESVLGGSGEVDPELQAVMEALGYGGKE